MGTISKLGAGDKRGTIKYRGSGFYDAVDVLDTPQDGWTRHERRAARSRVRRGIKFLLRHCHPTAMSVVQTALVGRFRHLLK